MNQHRNVKSYSWSVSLYEIQHIGIMGMTLRKHDPEPNILGEQVGKISFPFETVYTIGEIKCHVSTIKWMLLS